MKITTLLFVLLSINLSAQTWSAGIDGDLIKVYDSSSQVVPLEMDEMKWEYIFQGDCWNTQTGKLEPAHSYTFTLLPELSGGFMVQKVVWFGQVRPDGSVKWTSQTSPCYRRAIPQYSGTDTLYLQPANFIVPHGTQTPDWYYLTSTGNSVKAEPNGANPGGVQIETQVVTNSNGYLMPGPENLPPGMYYMTLVLKWQDMYFIETDGFNVP